MKVVAIIQARMNSTRLPGKILLPLGGKTVLEQIIYRVKYAHYVNNIVVATTDSVVDDEVEKLCNNINIFCYRGSEFNVLQRYYEAAKLIGADIIVRITADDPLKDPKIIDLAIQLLLGGNYDYVSNTIVPTFPEGIDIEVFTFHALEKASIEAKLDSEHEHVTPYIWKHPEYFSIHNFTMKPDLSKLRWTLDTELDYQFMQRVYKELFHEDNLFLMNDVLNLLELNPELSEINSGYTRNAGYILSIKNDVVKGVSEGYGKKT